jgi:hypothetical protein
MFNFFKKNPIACKADETKKEPLVKIFDADNQEYLFGGMELEMVTARYMASDWLKIHGDKYNEKSCIELRTV